MYIDVILFVMCKKITPFVMFTSISHSLCLVSVLSVVCWRAHVLFTIIVYVCVHSGVQHTLRCVFAFFLFRLVYPKLSASLHCHFWIVLWYSLTFSNRRLTFSQIVFGPPRFQPKIIILLVLFDIPT